MAFFVFRGRVARTLLASVLAGSVAWLAACAGSTGSSAVRRPTAPLPAGASASAARAALLPAPGASAPTDTGPIDGVDRPLSALHSQMDPAPPPGSVLSPLPMVPPDAVAPPYGPNVAARFPDPAIVYRTPAFAPGHTGFTTNAELHAILEGLARASVTRAGGPNARLLGLGTSQSGTPIEALLLAHGGAAGGISAIDIAESHRPTVLLIGQQHGDEPAGAEALIVIAESLARGALEPLLDRVNVVLLPRVNPDGAASAKRSSASGIDVDRDHLLLKTPEAQAVARLVREFTPMVVVDAQEYAAGADTIAQLGAVQRFDVLLQYAMTANLPEFVTKASEEWFRLPMLASLKAEGLSSEWYYTVAAEPLDRQLSMGSPRPDTSRNVNGLRNAVSLLVETRGGGLGRLHLARRVHTQVTAIDSVLASAAARADDLVKLRQYVDQDVAARACRGDMVVEALSTPSEHSLLMIDPVTGADRRVTVAWNSALQLRPVKLRARPCGYWLAASEADAAQRLRALGLSVERIDESGEVRGETYRETGRGSGARPDAPASVTDGSSGGLRVGVQTVPTLVDFAAGGFYVPLDQPLANLAIAALEPDTSDSYFANHIVTSLAAEARLLDRPALRTSPMP